MTNIELVACGIGLPSKSFTNEDLARTVDTSDEWITTRTGIRSRYFCTGEESNFSMAYAAASEAIDKAGIRPSDIGCVVCATLTSDYTTPSLACMLQKQLKLSEEIPALDVNAACTGFLYATEVARGFLDNSPFEYALVIGVEQLSRIMDMTDRSTCVLFGDGGAAAIYKKSATAPYNAFLGARGGMEISCGGVSHEGENVSISMDGKAVFRFAVDAMERCIKRLMTQESLGWDDLDYVICHQANARIIDHCVRKMKAPAEKFYKNMDHFGNTSAASVPLAIAELEADGRLKPGARLLLVGFGSGLTWGGAYLTYKGRE